MSRNSTKKMQDEQREARIHDHRIKTMRSFREDGPAGLRSPFIWRENWERFYKLVRRGTWFPEELDVLVWCRIYLSIAPVSDSLFFLHVTFENLCDEAIKGKFLYTEAWRGSEFIYVFDESGNTISGGRLIGVSRGAMPHWHYHDRHIGPGDFLAETFAVRRQEEGRWNLIWNMVEPGKTYYLLVNYHGVTSNLLSWKVPEG